MKRPFRERRWPAPLLAASLCAQSLSTICGPVLAQQAPTDPSGLGTSGAGGIPGGGAPGISAPGMGGYSPGTTQYVPGFNNYVPTAPSRPTPSTRPSSWPGSLPDPTLPPPTSVRRPAPLNPNGQGQNIYNQVPVSAAGAAAGNGAPGVNRYPDASPAAYSQFATPAGIMPTGSPAYPMMSPGGYPATSGASGSSAGAGTVPGGGTALGGGTADPSAPQMAGGPSQPLVNFPPRRPTVPSPFSVPSAQLEPTNGVLHFTGTEVIAIVGGDYILSGDVLPMIDESLENRAKAMGKSLKDMPKDEIDAARLIGIKQQLNRAIENKLLFAEAKRKIPKDNLPKVQDHANKIFEENECKRLMDAYQVKTRGELDGKLHEHGASLDAARNAFFESGIGNQFLHQTVKDESEISHEQMLAYYREHIVEYETPPKARWEHILVKFSEHNTKEECYQILAECGNKIYHGAPFAVIAKAHSEDSTASDGGMHDWTTKGSLVYKPLDEALFTLPVGKLSPIIEDDHGFSIIRVVDRLEVMREPFSEAQVEIKKKIRKERASGQMERYVEKLRAKTPIWTIFDSGPLANKPGAAAQR